MASYNTGLFASINSYITKTLTEAGVSARIASHKNTRLCHFIVKVSDDTRLISVESCPDGTIEVTNEEDGELFESFNNEDEASLLKLISRGILEPADTESKAEDEKETSPAKRKATSEEDAPVIKRQELEEEQDSPESPPVEPEDQPLSQVPIEVV
jgi:hypothetical protein